MASSSRGRLGAAVHLNVGRAFFFLAVLSVGRASRSLFNSSTWRIDPKPGMYRSMIAQSVFAAFDRKLDPRVPHSNIFGPVPEMTYTLTNMECM